MDASTTPPTVNANNANAANAGRERPLVLLVDDDPHDREIYGRILCHRGFDVVCVNDTSNGLRLVRRFMPDIVVLDIGGAGFPGLDLCAAIRTQPDTTAIPVIALSAHAEARIGERARLARCTRFVEKPASPLAVVGEVARIVGSPPPVEAGRPPSITSP